MVVESFKKSSCVRSGYQRNRNGHSPSNTCVWSSSPRHHELKFPITQRQSCIWLSSALNVICIISTITLQKQNPRWETATAGWRKWTELRHISQIQWKVHLQGCCWCSKSSCTQLHNPIWTESISDCKKKKSQGITIICNDHSLLQQKWFHKICYMHSNKIIHVDG